MDSFSDCEAVLRDNSLVNAFCSLPTSSGVKSDKSGEEVGLSWTLSVSSRLPGSLRLLLLPKVPIERKPFGQSPNSSLDSRLILLSEQPN